MSVFYFFLNGCSGPSLEEYQEEGVTVVRALTSELRKVENRQQLLEVSSKLENLFNKLADLMIAAQDFQKKYPTAKETHLNSHSKSHQLRAELNRLYQIEGCRQVIEKCEEQALQRLDFYQKKGTSALLKS